jgi:hypothetical protein
VILDPASALALGLTANDLLGTVNGSLKPIEAIGTTTGLAQADSSRIIGMNH